MCYYLATHTHRVQRTACPADTVANASVTLLMGDQTPNGMAVDSCALPDPASVVGHLVGAAVKDASMLLSPVFMDTLEGMGAPLATMQVRFEASMFYSCGRGKQSVHELSP